MAELSLMFGLMDHIPGGVTTMLADLEDFINQSGLDDMRSSAEIITSDSEKYVEELLMLFNRFSKLVKDAFHDDPRFLTARDKVLTHTHTHHTHSSSHCTSSHTHTHTPSGQRTGSH